MDKWAAFDHYSDIEYADKLKELGILPIKLKFALNDLSLFYKIVNKLVPIHLPAHFSVIRPGDVRLTRNTCNVIDNMDLTQIKCSMKHTCDIFKNCFFYKTMKLWNSIPYGIRQEKSMAIFKSHVVDFVLSSDLDCPE